MNIVDRARKFAQRAHQEQRRKYTNEPYFNHLSEVALLCAQHGLVKRAIAAAYLHDVIEDQPITYDDLVAEFGAEIATIVLELTDEPTIPGGPNRAARKKVDLTRLEGASADAQSVKCADMISNTRSVARHDKAFARSYLPEKRAALTVLTRAQPDLLALAWMKLREAEALLDA
jgi:(p)ppGpp synthase/HD superfamily hydrolase